MGSRLKEPADRRHLSLLMNGSQKPIMSRPHSGRTRTSHQLTRSSEQRCVTVNGVHSGKGNKVPKSANDQRAGRIEVGNYGIYEGVVHVHDSGLNEGFNFSTCSEDEPKKDELVALFTCSTAQNGRIKDQAGCEKASSSGTSKMRPHTAHTSTDKTKSSSCTEVKKDEKVSSNSNRVKGTNRKVLHRSISVSSLPDRINFGKVSSHRRNCIPMLNCYGLNDFSAEMLPKIINAASYTKSKAEQRKNSSADTELPKKGSEAPEKPYNKELSADHVPTKLLPPSEISPRITKVASLLPLLGFKLGQNEAAARIQKWYKRHSARRKAADAALKRMQSSPSISGVRKRGSASTKLQDMPSDIKTNHLFIEECTYKATASCISSNSALQRKKSCISLHVVPTDDGKTSYNSFPETTQSVLEAALEAPVTKRHLIHRRRKSDGDIAKHSLKTTHDSRRSLSDNALKADHSNEFKSRCTLAHPKKTVCSLNRPATIQCYSAPRDEQSQVHSRAAKIVKLSEKGVFSTDSLVCVRKCADNDNGDYKGNGVSMDSWQQQEQGGSENDILFAMRPSNEKAVIIRRLPSEETSGSAASDGGEIKEDGNMPSKVQHQSSREQHFGKEAHPAKAKSPHLCDERSNTSKKVVDELFNISGMCLGESIIPLQLKNIERLLLRSSSTDDGSASAPTVMTEVNSETCTMDSLDCNRKNLLLPVAPSPEKKKTPLQRSTLDSAGNREKGLTVQQVEQLNNQSKYENLENNGILTDSKLRDIMVFLDEVENTDDLCDVRSTATLPKPITSAPGTKALTAVINAGRGGRKYMANRAIKKDDLKGNSVRSQLTRKTVSSDSLESADERESKNIPICPRSQVIERQLAFIDKLLEEKAVLAKKYEELLNGTKDSTKKFEQKIKRMKEQHAFDLKRFREWQAANEKVRREKWITDQTKKIQDKTVQRMEPEIKRMVSRHHTDLKELKERHTQEMQEANVQMQKKLDAEVENVQKAVAEKIERAVASEREATQKRLDERIAQERSCFDEKDRQMTEEITHLRNLFEIQEQQFHLKLEQARSNFEATRKKDIESLQAEYIRRHEDEVLRHQSEIKRIKEKLHQEYRLKEDALHKQHEEAIFSQEKDLREQYKKDRDQQIELVLRRLEDETTTSRQESDRAVEHRIRSLREKHEAEVEELEQSNQSMTARVQEMKIRLASIEEENLMLRDTCKQKKLEMNEMTKIIAQLNKNKTAACEAIHQQYEQQLLTTSKTVEELQNKLLDMEDQHQSQRDKAQIEHSNRLAAKDKELDDVSRRVRLAISKKDDTIGKLKADYNAALTRADQYEKLLIKFKK